jgi:hypothetical protein
MVTTEMRRIYKQRYKEKHPDKFRADKRRYKEKHPDKTREAIKKCNLKLRYNILKYYSYGKMVCNFCGENHYEFLEIDHMAGNGKDHKRQITISLYSWLKQNNYPSGYQVLCSNCNNKKERKKSRMKEISYTVLHKRNNQKYKNLKFNVFSHYKTDNKIQCSCCGVNDLDILCTDHINGDGAKHRASGELGTHGQKIYSWLKRNNYPPGFRILCHNCNQSIGKYGYCPHDKPLL